MEDLEVKKIVQYARIKRDPTILKSLDPESVYIAREFLKKIDEPLLHRWLLNNEVTGGGIDVNFGYYSELTLPHASDPLLNTTLDFLSSEFLNYLEEKHFICLEYREKSVRVYGFEQVDLNELFFSFLREKYDDKILMERWNLIKATYRLGDYKEYPEPTKLRDFIIEKQIPLEVENKDFPFGDEVKDFCLFCGRQGDNYIARSGFADFSSQRAQTGITTKNPRICPICLFSVYVSPIRTSSGTGQRTRDLIALKTSKREEPYSYVFNKLMGVSTGEYISIDIQEDRLGKTALVYLSSSRLPLYTLEIDDFDIKNLSTNSNLEKERIMAIKIFEEVLGFTKIWSYSGRQEQEYQKALYEILKGNYFALIKHLGILMQNKGRWKDMALDNGIYELIKSGVIKMEDRPDIIFGTALLIDAFLPEQWKAETEELKTEIRKVAYYLEKPEEVLYRLRQVKKDDYTTLKMDFTNKAQYKLLKELLKRIHDEEDLGDFEEEQLERKKKIEESKGFTYEEEERLFLRFDDILKVYVYIQGILSDKYGDNPKRLKKEYSELMNRIKYALIARRPELLEGGV